MPVYEDTQTQILGRPVRPVVYLEPVPYEELEQRPQLPRDWREAISRVEGEPGYPPAAPTPPPSEPPWPETLAQVLRGAAEELVQPLLPLWDLGIRQGLNPLSSLHMRLGGALGWWPTLSQLEQEMQTRAGVSIPVQQWLKENTNYYQAEPGEPQLEHPYAGTHIPVQPRSAPVLAAVAGDPSKPLVSLSGSDPQAYAHEALHAWFDEKMAKDPDRMHRFIAKAYQVANMDPLALSPRQRSAWEAIDRWRHALGRNPYFGSTTELHSYLGQTAWQQGLDAIPEPLREFYLDFYAPG